MARSQHQLLEAPIGFVSNADPANLPQNRAQEMVGFYPARNGRARCVPVLRRLKTLDYVCNSLAYYNAENSSYDKLVLSMNGGLYTVTVSTSYVAYNGKQHISLDVATPALQEATAGGPWRTVQYKKELLLFPSSGAQPFRYYADSGGTQKIYYLGITTSGAPTLAQAAGGSLTLLSTYTYVTTDVDELGREGSPSPSTAFTLTGANQTIQVTHGTGSTGGLYGTTQWKIYRKNPGATTYNLVTTVTFPTTSYNDTTADATVAAAAEAPASGENDKPNAASIVTVWKNRVVLNDTTNPNNIQISNADSPTQFASFSSTTDAAAGLRVAIGSEYGDEITGLIPLGSVLCILKRRSAYLMFGEDATNFYVQQVHERGCVNPDSVQRTENEIVFLSNDGLFAFGYQNGYSMAPRSYDIDDVFRSYIKRTRDDTQNPDKDVSMELYMGYGVTGTPRVQSWYFDRRYFLALPDKCLCMDEMGGGWTDTGYGFVRAVTGTRNYLLPEVTFLTLGDDTAYDSVLYAITTSDRGDEFDTLLQRDPKYILVQSPQLLTRPFDGGELPEVRVKRADRYTLFGETTKKEGDELGSMTLVVDGQETEEYPIYAGQRFDNARALYQQEFTPAAVGRLLQVKLNITDPSFVLGSQMLEYTPRA